MTTSTDLLTEARDLLMHVANIESCPYSSECYVLFQEIEKFLDKEELAAKLLAITA